MDFLNKLQKGIPTLSYEFFPPKTEKGWSTLENTLRDASKLGLDFVSVTYGAGGSTRENTVELTGKIRRDFAMTPMAHLTCLGHSRDEIGNILDTLQKNGVQTVMALRGDAPKGVKNFQPHPEGFDHATGLIEFMQGRGMCIGCACYPETHPEAQSAESDLKYLKQKQDVGADFAATQLFFDNEVFYRFRDRARAAGITLPMVAGIMPVTSLSQIERFREISGCSIPDELLKTLGSDEEKVLEQGIEYAVRQCDELLKHGVSGIHLYTLNKSRASHAIVDRLREMGHLGKVKSVEFNPQ